MSTPPNALPVPKVLNAKLSAEDQAHIAEVMRLNGVRDAANVFRMSLRALVREERKRAGVDPNAPIPPWPPAGEDSEAAQKPAA